MFKACALFLVLVAGAIFAYFTSDLTSSEMIFYNQ